MQTAFARLRPLAEAAALAVYLTVGDLDIFYLCAAAGGLQALRGAYRTPAMGERKISAL
jgi:hypothetical protein